MLYVLLMPDDPEGIYSGDQSQSRSAPPAHLNLAGIVHILDRSDITRSQVAPFILHVDQFNDRSGIILFAQSQYLLAAGKWLITNPFGMVVFFSQRSMLQNSV